ncbi:MAG: ABC transporter permease subunit [Mariniblastus sp.]
MLSQLLWKDIQSQKGMLLLGAFFLLAPYLLYLFVGANSQSPEYQLANSATLSLVFSQLTIVVMGASIVGAERQNHGMDFLLALPAPRSQILLSKTIVSLLVAAVIWGVFFVVSEFVVVDKLRDNFQFVGLTCGVIGATLFAVAWLGSILWKSTAVSIAVSLTVTAVVALVQLKFWHFSEWNVYEHGKQFIVVLCSVYAAIAIGAFAAGWLVFTRRFEP